MSYSRLEIEVMKECPHLFLNPGEKICKPCKGWGFKIHRKYVKGDRVEHLSDKRCPRCLGRGALEFIDAAVGQNRDPRWMV